MRRRLSCILAGVALGWLSVLGGGCLKQLRYERHVIAARRDVAQGDYRRAEIDYGKAIALDPSDWETIGRLGVLYYREGRTAQAFGLLQGALDNGVVNPRVRTAFALSNYTFGRLDEARTAAKTVLTEEPENEEALLVLVNASNTGPDRAEARRMILAMRARDRDAAPYHVALGVLCTLQADWAEAEAEFRKALALDPKSAMAEDGLFQVCLEKRDLKAAAAHLQAAAEDSPIRSPVRLAYVDFLLRTGAVAAGRRALDEITSQAPDFLPGWVRAMQLAGADHHDAECLEDARRILAVDSRNYEALMQRARLKVAAGDLDGAIADYQTLRGFYPRAPAVRFEFAAALVKKGDTGRAEDELREALALAPTYDEAILLLADLQMQEGETEDAIVELEGVVARGHRNAATLMLLAQAYRLDGKLDQAANTYRELARLAPNAPEGPYFVGMTLLQQNRPQPAQKEFERSVELSGDYWPAVQMLVEMDLHAGRLAAASARVARLRSAYPKAPDPWYYQAKIDLAEKRTTAAESDLERAIDLAPSAAYPYFELAGIYLDRGEPKAAVARLESISKRTQNLTAMMEIGMIRERLKEYGEAKQVYERLLAVRPQYIPALNNLAVLYGDHQGDPAKGYVLAQEARALAPASPVVADTLGWIQYELGQYTAAVASLQQAADGLPAEAEVQYHLGMAQYRLDEETEARAALSRAVAGLPRGGPKADAARRLAVLEVDPERAGADVRANLESWVREDPRDPVALVRLAAVESAQGAPAQAVRHDEAALALAPDSVPILVALARLYAGPVWSPDKVRDLVRQAHGLQPDDGEVTRELGRLLYAVGDYVWSVDLLEQARQMLGNQPELEYELARAYYGAGRQDDAQSALDQALASGQAFPDEPSAQRLSRLIAVLQRSEGAQSELEEARETLEREPGSLAALMVVALGEEAAGEPAKAGATYESILAKDAGFAPAARNLAILYAERLRNDDRAMTLALVARNGFPEDPVLAYELGAISYRRRDFLGAVNYLQQSLSEKPDDPRAMCYLGLAHYELKDLVAARSELERAMAMRLPVQERDDAERTLRQINLDADGFGTPGIN